MNKTTRRILLKWSFLVDAVLLGTVLLDWFLLDAAYFLPLVLLQVAVVLAVLWLFLQRPAPTPAALTARAADARTIHYRGLP